MKCFVHALFPLPFLSDQELIPKPFVHQNQCAAVCALSPSVSCPTSDFFLSRPCNFNFSQIQYHVCIVVLLLQLYVKSHSLMGTMNPSKVGYFFYECLSCDSLLPMITGSQSVFVSCLSACFVPAPCGSIASDLSMGVPFTGDSLLALTRPPQIKGDGSEPALIQPPLCPRKVTSQNRRIHEWTHFKFACFRVWEE